MNVLKCNTKQNPFNSNYLCNTPISVKLMFPYTKLHQHYFFIETHISVLAIKSIPLVRANLHI